MFGDNFPKASGDIKYLIYDMASQDHVIEVSGMLWLGTSHSKLPPSQVWLQYSLW